MTEATEQHVNITRTFDAPRELVWRAWTEPEQLAQWWGPEHFHTPLDSVDLDLREGGHIHLSMIEDGSGNDYPVRFQIVELVEPELLVFFSPAQPELGLTTDTTTRIELTEEDGKTVLTLVDGPYAGDMANMTNQGWNQQFDKLVALLAG